MAWCYYILGFWLTLYIIQNHVYSCYIQGKRHTSHIFSPLDEIYVDTVPNLEPLGLSSKSRYWHNLIFHNRYFRIFRLCGIRDKTTDACIDGINLIISSIPLKNKHISHVTHICSDSGSEFASDTFQKWYSDNKNKFSSIAPKYWEQNGLVECHCRTSGMVDLK